MKKHREPRPTSFEVTLEKGDYKLPSEVAPGDEFEDILDSYITVELRIGGEKTRMRLAVWKACGRDRQATAATLGITEESLKKFFQRLKKTFYGQTTPPGNIPPDEEA